MKNLVFLFVLSMAYMSCQSGGSGSSGDVLDNGYRYKIHNANGGATPQPGDYVEFDLDLLGDDGSLIQSMRGRTPRPSVTIPKDELSIKQSASNPIMSLLQVMSKGDSASVYIPVDSIPQKSPDMADMKEIIYVAVVTDIKSEAEYKAEQEKLLSASQAVEAEKMTFSQNFLKTYLAGKSTNKVIEAEGMKIVMIEEGTGPKAENGKTVNAQYLGMLKDGTSFDNSFKRGTPFSFQVGTGSVIKGWDVGFAQLNPGSKALLDIPYALAYGEAGRPPSIPAKSNLYFYVELESVK